jgi:hypothetical protein
MSNQIDECSDCDQEADDLDINMVTFKKKKENDNSEDEIHSNKSLRDSADDPFGHLSEGEGTGKAVVGVDQKGTGSFFNEINSMKAYVEPKSGLLRREKNHKKVSSSFMRRGGSAMKATEFTPKTFINLD